MSELGIIPAHAGLTTHSSRGKEPLWDHPRACGAHNLRYPARHGS